MEEYKVRLIKEYNELKERYGKLGVMLEKHHNGTLHFTPTCPIELLQNQHRVMGEYKAILEERATIENIEL